MKTTRRSFIEGTIAAVGAAFLPTAVCAAEEDWKAAFRSLGFDPNAPGSSVFVITSDIHADKWHVHLAEHVAFWNSMDPKPAFVCALGDFANINQHFGHRPSEAEAARRAAAHFGPINEVLTKGLRPDIPRVYVIGNHDSYPGEGDLALWREYFPDQPPYCAFDACGLRFVKWNGGGDGMIDAAQEKWIMEECAKCPKDKQLVVLVHQPSVGMCGMERDIGRVARAALAGRPGVTWLLGGHEHGNDASAWTLPGGGALAVAVHTMDLKGWWMYGVRQGRIVARLFKGEGTPDFSRERMPSEFPSKGNIPVAYEGRTDVVWNAFVGSEAEKRSRVVPDPAGDNGGWLFYVGHIVNRFPKKQVAPSATRFGILGRLWGERKTHAPAPVFFSSDGKNWIESKQSAVVKEVYEYPIPSGHIDADELWMRYDGWGFGADECHAGYAFLK